MKKTFLLLMVLCQTICLSAQKHESIMHIRAVAPAHEVTLLDSVKGDDYERIYAYNKYGYITSMMEKHKNAGVWELDTDNSYIQDFTFDADGACTKRIRYAVNANGERVEVTNKAEVVVIDGITWQRFYEQFDGNLCLSEAYSYDKWGNVACIQDYRYDWEKCDTYLDEVEEWGYSGPLPPRNHYNYRRFRSSYLTYHVKAEERDGVMKVQEAEKVETIKESDRIIRRRLTRDYNTDVTLTLDNWERYMRADTEDVYYLNAKGTRPVKKESYEYYYYSYNDVDRNMREVEFFEWDELDRLTRRYNNSYGEEERYTFADNRVTPLTLNDIIADRPSLYNEEDYSLGGWPATAVFQSQYEKEERTFEYENGKIVKVTYREQGDLNGDGRNDDDDVYGTMYIGYNEAGHMAYYIDEVHEDGQVEYIKLEFVYDQRGTWIGEIEYDGESLDGPWVEYSSYYPSDNYDRRARRLGAKRHKAPNISDMSDGYHNVWEDDGVWRTEGYYVVSDGQIMYGYINQSLVSNASRPVNPETYYTDPVAPMEWDYAELISVGQEIWWSYVWDDGAWQLKDAPGSADRYYRAGEGVVRCDTYNRDQQVIASRTYYLDAENRLVRTEDNGVTTNEYTYLPGTNYIDTHTFYGTVRHYFYSQHNYVDPSGIDTVDMQTKSGVSKRIEDGRIVIVKNGAKYTTAGQRVE